MSLRYVGDQATAIREALMEAFPSVPLLRLMVQEVLGKPLNFYVNEAQALPLVIQDLALGAEAEGALDTLIAGAHRKRPGLAALADLYGILEDSQSGAVTEVSLYERTVLRGEKVFFDRKPFREMLEKVNAHEARRIVVVKGADKSGKSYSVELIRQEARECGYNTTSVGLRTLSKTDSIKSLATFLVSEMAPQGLATTVPEQGTESLARWTHHPLMGWTIGWMRQAEGVWWIVFDEFDRDLVSHDVYQFLVDFAKKIEDDVPNCRLAMLGYDREIPPEWDQRHRLETIGSLEQKHLEDFFDCLYRQQGLPPDEQITRELAQAYYAKYRQQATDFENDSSSEVKPPLLFLNEELRRFAEPEQAAQD